MQIDWVMIGNAVPVAVIVLGGVRAIISRLNKIDTRLDLHEQLHKTADQERVSLRDAHEDESRQLWDRLKDQHQHHENNRVHFAERVTRVETALELKPWTTRNVP